MHRVQRIKWRIEQRVLGISMHVTRELMSGLGIDGASDYYASKSRALAYMEKYANKVASMGMHTEIVLMSGTFN